MRRLNNDDYDYTICMLKSAAKGYYADTELMDDAIKSIEQLRADLNQAVDTIHGFARKEQERLANWEEM